MKRKTANNEIVNREEKNKLDPDVFLEAAIRIFEKKNIGCCGALAHSTNDYNEFEPYKLILESHYNPCKQFISNHFWWEDHLQEPRIIALLLLYWISKDLNKQP